jgi:antitoxin component YwqK of YwqJK toxin-antitoxin module
MLWATLAVAGWFAATAAAGKNVCSYNGKEYDDRYPPPKDFTGEYTCKNSDSGKIVLREHHVRGRQDGDYTQYYDRTGEIVESGRYRDGKLDGPMRSYRDGVAYQERNWVRGKLQGVQKEFVKGKLSRLYLVDDNGGRGNGIRFNAKGQPTSLECGSSPIGRQDSDWCGLTGKQSIVTLYDDQGRKCQTVQYLAGKAHGVWKTFKPGTDVLLSETRYENGNALKDGQQQFSRDGTLLVKTTCDDNKTTCTETVYFDGGKEAKTAPSGTAGTSPSRRIITRMGRPNACLFTTATGSGSPVTTTTAR